VALFQVSIALGAVPAAACVWFGSMGLGFVGIILFAKTLFG
jgi:hypothetical protein